MADETGKKQAREVLGVTLAVLYSRANKDKVLGLNVPSDWEDMLALMKAYNGLTTNLPTSAFYTNEFLPSRICRVSGSVAGMAHAPSSEAVPLRGGRALP